MKILYILVRGDLPSMGYGKGAAQASHASNAFVEAEIVRPLEKGKKPNPDANEWRKSTAQGFGTVLTLEIGDLPTMQKVVEAANQLGYPAEVITDPTYPYHVPTEIAALIDEKHHAIPPSTGTKVTVCFRIEQTCAYVFGEKGDLDVLLARFKLLPNE